VKEISIRTYFLKIVLPIVGVVWLAMTGLFTWNDYNVNLESRSVSEELVSETFVLGIKQPLIQGSFLEAKIRAESLLKSSEVKCIKVIVGSDLIHDCPESFAAGRFVHQINKSIFFSDEQNQEYARVSLFFDNKDLIVQCLNRLVRAAIGFAVLALLLFFVLTKGMNPIKKEIYAILTQAKEDPSTMVRYDFRISECSMVSDALRKNMKIASQVAQANASLAVAKQVAHDIRSPLASLKMLIDDVKGSVPESHVAALTSNAKRISEIASDLIEKHEVKVRAHFEELNAGDVCEEILIEKRNVFRKLPQVNFEITNNSKNSRILINPSDFRRVLSNLLDNAVEACAGEGKIKVKLNNLDKNLEIQISDSGVGIADDVIVRLFKPGATFGKPNGKGLGLAHAKSTIEAAGGKIGIFSQQGVGTEIRITIETLNRKSSASVSDFSKRNVIGLNV
jgi:signal transduction histidine kinase